jgi:hypothetical protein
MYGRVSGIAANTAVYSDVIDLEDLYQAGMTAVFTGINKVDCSRSPNEQAAFLHKCAQRAIYKEANKFRGCFTLNLQEGVEACKAYKDPHKFQHTPIFFVITHKVEEFNEKKENFIRFRK